MNLRMLAFTVFILAVICSPVWAIYCTSCGNNAGNDSRFCDQCGKAFVEVTQPGIENPPINVTVVVGSYSVLAPAPRPQAFQVTSNYLLVNGYRIYQNSSFWIAEVSGSRARVWTVSEPPYNELVMGWVSLAELEKRSTLKPSTSIYCVEPPPPSARIVVVERRSFWQRWGFSSGSSRGGHHPRPVNRPR